MIYSIKSILPNRIDPMTSKPMEIELDLFHPLKNGLAVTNVSNTGPVKANTVMDDWATIDGGSVNTAHRSYRNIVITLRYIDGGKSIEEIRHLTYKYFPVKEKIRLVFKTDTRDYYIDGVVDDNNVPMWTDKEASGISIFCGDPFFYEIDEKTLTFVKSVPQFHFFGPTPVTKEVDPFMPSDRYEVLGMVDPENPPTKKPVPAQYMLMGRKIRSRFITINNPSNMDIGLKINMTALGGVEEPRFVNLTTNEGFFLKGLYSTSDSITINTRPGHKSVTYADGSNAIIKMDLEKSKWIRLQPGDNVIKYDAKAGSALMDVSLQVRPLYEGI